MRLIVAVAVSLAASVPVANADEIEQPGPGRPPLLSIGGYAEQTTGFGVGVDEDMLSVSIKGPRVGVRVRGNAWVVGSIGWGDVVFDDGYAQDDGSAWEAQAALGYHECSAGNVRFCVIPSIGLGYQRAWATFIDGLVDDGEPWTERYSRIYLDTRLTASLVLGGHVSLSVSLGLRPVLDTLRGAEWTSGWSIAGTAGVDVEI